MTSYEFQSVNLKKKISVWKIIFTFALYDYDGEFISLPNHRVEKD